MDEGKRARKLGFDMLDVLSAAELNRPILSGKIQQVEDFFQVFPHPNPEMKVVQRVDWLDKADYKPSVTRIGQLEIHRNVFFNKAIAFLGRTVTSILIGIVDRFAQLSLVANTPDSKAQQILGALDLGKEILNVSGFFSILLPIFVFFFFLIFNRYAK